MPKITRDDEPFWASGGNLVELHCGDVIDVLKRLPVRSVQTVVTSPPYWALRDYGTGEWAGGDPKCNHARKYGGGTNAGTSDIQRKRMLGGIKQQYENECPKCGAKRVDNQLGSEATPDEFVEKMVEVFNWVKRVLRRDGTVWLNLGDTYGVGLHGIPWRVALALQQNGWILRQDIIWSKPSPMPESVRNRCTRAHEYLFLLTKSENYYYDADAIKTKTISEPHAPRNSKSKSTSPRTDYHETEKVWGSSGTNKRSVWTISSESYPGAHFATFPRKLVEPCILAGTSEYGCCDDCGRPYKRVVERGKYSKQGKEFNRKSKDKNPHAGQNNEMDMQGGGNWPVKTTGWEAQCNCAETTGRRDVVPCTVLDPFVGSGTTCVVAIAHGRRSVGIDLSADYLTNQAVPRIQGELMSRPALAHLANVEHESKKLGRKIRSKR